MFSAPAALEDILQVLLPADEIENIGVLLRRAEGIRSPAFEELADLRMRLLTHLAHHAGGEEGATTDWIPALERITSVHRRWLASTPGLSRDQIESRERQLLERDHQLSALKHLLRQPCPVGPPPALSVGEAALNSLDELQGFTQAAAKMEGLDPDRSNSLISSARRFPVPDPPGAERFGAADQLPLSLIDRVDALHVLFEIMPTPRAAMLLSQAQLLVGRVFRDADVLEELYRAIPDGDSVSRRTFAVALGLLGEHLPFEDVVPDQSNYEDAVAWVLSIVLAEGPGAWSTVNQADRRAKGAARKVTDAALARIEVGYLFSVVG